MAFRRTGANRRRRGGLITQSCQANLAVLRLSRSTDAVFRSGGWTAVLPISSYRKYKGEKLSFTNQESAVISSKAKYFSTFQEQSRKSSHAN